MNPIILILWANCRVTHGQPVEGKKVLVKYTAIPKHKDDKLKIVKLLCIFFQNRLNISLNNYLLPLALAGGNIDIE
jgi:hypothetical protein